MRSWTTCIANNNRASEQHNNINIHPAGRQRHIFGTVPLRCVNDINSGWLAVGAATKNMCANQTDALINQLQSTNPLLLIIMLLHYVPNCGSSSIITHARFPCSRLLQYTDCSLSLIIHSRFSTAQSQYKKWRTANTTKCCLLLLLYTNHVPSTSIIMSLKKFIHFCCLPAYPCPTAISANCAKTKKKNSQTKSRVLNICTHKHKSAAAHQIHHLINGPPH